MNLPSVFDGHAVDIVVLEIVAGRFRLLLAEPGEAGTVQRGLALAYGLGECIGARQKARCLALHGAQALLGFQLVGVLLGGFEHLPASSQYIHVVSLGLVTLSTILLMTPAAYHRLVEQG